jgi:hypothetical protein
MKVSRKLIKSTLIAVGSASILFSAVMAKADVNLQLQQQRIEVLSAGQKGAASLPILIAAMKIPNVMLRLAAVRSMGEIGTPAESTLTAALKSDEDALVRRTALRMLMQIKGKDAIAVLETALGDSNELVRATAVQLIADMRPYTPQTTALLKKAQQDPSNDVSQVASQALWPFHQEGISVREKREFKDHQLTVAQTIPMEKENWRFHFDPGQTGQMHNWFSANFDDDSWQTFGIEKTWEGLIDKPYNGAGWYRKSFILPAKPEQVGTDIVFDAVNQSAWVWINGQYIGQHDIGPDGWNKSFAIDVSDALKWGQENQITVRVLGSWPGGGIWKPVYFEVLKQ